MADSDTTGRFLSWIERDIEKMKRQADATWAKTDLGLAGVSRQSVSWWRRKVAIFQAARAGRYVGR